MKSNMHPFLVLVTLFVFTSFSCKKSAESRLPPATQTGANTFGCLINGEVFIPKDTYSYPVTPGLIAGFIPGQNRLIVSAGEPPNGNKNGLSRLVHLEVISPKVGENPFNSLTHAEVDISEHFQLDKIFRTSYTSIGNITITRLDTNAKIISGTFSFDAYQIDSTQNIMNVRNGRFDITY